MIGNWLRVLSKRTRAEVMICGEYTEIAVFKLKCSVPFLSASFLKKKKKEIKPQQKKAALIKLQLILLKL